MNVDPDALTSLPEYQSLIHKRRRIIWPLAILTVAVYMVFILVIAFAPALLGKPIGDGTVSIGIVLGILLILFNFIITLLYVFFANRHLQPLIERIHAKAGGL